MPVFSQASRRYSFVSGVGGNILVQQHDPAGVAGGAIVTFDVAQWIIRHIYLIKATPHSGMNGGLHRTQTGHDWSFRAQVSFPAEALTGSLAAGFPETFLGSSRGVQMRFNLGHPEFWTSRSLEVRSYQGPALTEFIETDNDGSGLEEVKLNVQGLGMGLLIPYVGTTPQEVTGGT
jgi:hypothetical protein